MAVGNNMFLWQIFVLIAGGFIAFLIIRLLWRMNFPKK
jgi:hypothetical protein